MKLPKETLRQILDANHRTPPTIVFSNFNYKEISDNWIRAVDRLNIENFWFFSLDKQMHAYLSAKGINTILLECDKELAALWKLRISVFNILVDEGIDFIHTDADAVWLKDPIERYYNRLNKIDLVASQGTIWPTDIFSQYSFVLCCGFFILRANQRTAMLLQDLEADVDITGDDQVSLNRHVFKRNLNWEITSPYHLSFKDNDLLVSDYVMVGEGNDLTVGVIPFVEVPRIHLDNNNPYVEHPLTPKDNDKKKIFFQEIGLWR